MSKQLITNQINTTDLIKKLLNNISQEREREIIARRFGLFDRKETLEQIGEMLGITRERVRQLEKTVTLKLKLVTEEGKIPDFLLFIDNLTSVLTQYGDILKINDISDKLYKTQDKTEQSRIMFLALMSSKMIVLNENDNYYNSIALKSTFTDKKLLNAIDNIVNVIQKKGSPVSINDLIKLTNNSDSKQLESLANISKKIAYLNKYWGLTKWPTVNPRNIRDKIYVILKENNNHMHFNEIASAIKKSDFKRKNVTTQAIHNELIKDKRFVLVGRGIYALTEWGYQKGTVADIITKILQDANEPLHRDEIVKRVLKDRFVKETTILLNLQGKSQFKRVAKATYSLAKN